MVAKNETLLDARITNHPGAAAQPRPPASTGFRGGDATSGLGLSPNALNINGANTYQFVTSNPVGRMDAWGTGLFMMQQFVLTEAEAEPPGGRFNFGKCVQGRSTWHVTNGQSMVHAHGTASTSTFISNFAKDKCLPCCEVKIIQYAKKLSSQILGLSENAPGHLEIGNPFPPATNMGPRVSGPGLGNAWMTDSPGEAQGLVWSYNWLDQVFFDLDVCTKGKEAGNNYGGVFPGFYMDNNHGVVTRWADLPALRPAPRPTTFSQSFT